VAVGPVGRAVADDLLGPEERGPVRARLGRRDRLLDEIPVSVAVLDRELLQAVGLVALGQAYREGEPGMAADGEAVVVPGRVQFEWQGCPGEAQEEAHRNIMSVKANMSRQSFSLAPPGRHISGPVVPKVPLWDAMTVMSSMSDRSFVQAPPGCHVSGPVEPQVLFWTSCPRRAG